MMENTSTAKKALLFRVSNHHVKECVTPPAFNGDEPGKQYSYFENEHGEQLVFVYDSKSKEALLWHGDAGWATPYRVTGGIADGLILSEAEQLWLRACRQVANMP